MLSEEESEKIKRQILEHIESSFPENQKEQAKSQILAMNSPQLEEFLEKNNLVQSEKQQKCIFCSIVSNEISSFKIDEDKNAVAVLEINPISKGHAIIIPKKHVSEKSKIPKTVTNFAQKIFKKIKSELSPKEILVSSSNLFGHEVLNLIPVYTNETPDSKRSQAKKEDLEELQKILLQKIKKSVEKKLGVKKIEEKFWLPRRIP